MTELDELLEWLKTRHGVHVPETQRAAVLAFVGSRQKGRRWAEYLQALEADDDERNALIDASTIGETYFFRDEAQFRVLRNEILPRFRRHFARHPTIWSAACSTGEEALSLLFLLADVWGLPVEACKGRVWASDVNRTSLHAFERGEFRSNSVREDGQGFHRLLEPYLDTRTGTVRVPKSVVDLVERRPLNLIADDLEVLPLKFDLIVLRNMMIYVALEERPTIYRRIVDRLSDEGVLILGKAELPFFQDDEMSLAELDGTFVFVRNSSSVWTSTERKKAWPART
jgi:chemotaxis protein methyltransferase CheR